jgi:penicillin-binding protein 2A
MQNYRWDSSSIPQGPLPPRSRSERVGSRSRSARTARTAGSQPAWRRFFNWKWVMLVVLTVLLLTVGGCSAIMMSAQMYDFKQVKDMPLASKIMAKDGNGWKPVGQFGAEQREYVSLKDMRRLNSFMVNAFVKTEDRRFYQHSGIDFRGMGRAVVKDIITMGNAQGASTITQQVCKNIVLKDPSKNFTRKIKEIGCALNLV